MNIGLWKTISEKGTEYYRGSKNGVEINGVKYRVSLFINKDKKSEKSPDMSVVLSEVKEEKKEVNEFDTLNTKTSYQDKKSDVTLSDADLPF